MVAANSLLEQIQSKPFDQVVVSSSLGSKVDQNKSKLVADLTLPLGPEAGERYPFNDLDDYNGYSCKVWNPLGSDSLSLITTVYYVNASNPSQWSGVRTEAKKVIVKVFAPGMTDTLAFQQVVFQ